MPFHVFLLMVIVRKFSKFFFGFIRDIVVVNGLTLFEDNDVWIKDETLDNDNDNNNNNNNNNNNKSVIYYKCNDTKWRHRNTKELTTINTLKIIKLHENKNTNVTI